MEVKNLMHAYKMRLVLALLLLTYGLTSHNITAEAVLFEDKAVKSEIIDAENKDQKKIIDIQSSLTKIDQKINKLQLQNEKINEELKNLESQVTKLNQKKISLNERLIFLKDQTKKQINLRLILFKTSKQNAFLNIDFFSKFLRSRGMLKHLNQKTLSGIDNIDYTNAQIIDAQNQLSSRINDLTILQKESQKTIKHLFFEKEQKLVFLNLIKKTNLTKVSLADVTSAQLQNIKDINEQANSKTINISKNKKVNNKKTNLDALDSKNKHKKSAKELVDDLFNKKHLPWPVDGKILQKFKPVDASHIKAYRSGILINPNQKNSSIISVMAGKVAGIRLIKDNLYSVLVEHATGLYSIYSLLNNVEVELNQNIPAKTTIGKINKESKLKANTNFLYFELQIDYQSVDPLPLMVKAKNTF